MKPSPFEEAVAAVPKEDEAAAMQTDRLLGFNKSNIRSK
jgi:hypothetical protein